MSGSSSARAARSAFAGSAAAIGAAERADALRLGRADHPRHLRVGGQRRHQRVQRQPVGQVARAPARPRATAARSRRRPLCRPRRWRAAARSASSSTRASVAASARSAHRRAASTPTLARSSSTDRARSAGGSVPAWRSSRISRPPLSRQSRTRVAPPWLIVTRPACSSRFSASRTACRLTPRSSASRRSDGHAVAGRQRARQDVGTQRGVHAVGDAIHAAVLSCRRRDRWSGGRVRFIAAALKAADHASGPGVRIPPAPSLAGSGVPWRRHRHGSCAQHTSPASSLPGRSRTREPFTR